MEAAELAIPSGVLLQNGRAPAEIQEQQQNCRIVSIS